MSVIDIVVPDIGDFSDVEVIEILVKEGDEVAAEQSLVTVESDKASMEIPSAAAGRITSLTVKLGDKVSKGSVLGKMEAGGAAAPASAPAAQPAAAAPAQAAAQAAPAPAASQPAAAQAPASAQAAAPAQPAASSAAAPAGSPRTPAVPAELADGAVRALPHASPSVCLLARELGVDLNSVRGTGPKDRILADDVKAFVGYELIIDLPNQVVTTTQGEVIGAFEIDAFRKNNLLNGLDEIGLTLQHADDIRAYEARRFQAEPWLQASLGR